MSGKLHTLKVVQFEIVSQISLNYMEARKVWTYQRINQNPKSKKNRQHNGQKKKVKQQD